MSHTPPSAAPQASSLLQALAPSFSEGVRHKGHEYFRLGHVRIVRASQEDVVATVMAGRPYRVRLSLDLEHFGDSCTCPDSSVSRCAHVWAVFLYAEAHGHLRTPPAKPAAPALGEDEVKHLMRELQHAIAGYSPRRPPRQDTWQTRLAAFGEAEGDRVRFRPSQAALLDALLAAQPAAEVDETFARARAALLRFEGIAPADPPGTFRGELREYQREGLGWLRFLEGFGFSGCLADDMGLGKTVQVLALLESRRVQRELTPSGTPPSPGGRPSLLVVPRSLVFNWKKEAERFVPRLRILDHTGPARPQDTAAFQDHDVVLTTYGTLRRDIILLKEPRFDYAILDEAQAIKNAHTDSAKAARLLQADHRLALSGTPVENHVGELWSLFEFLNPGMLGRSSALDVGAGGDSPDAETRLFLARALRPFVLRRTKEQVARDLPAKTEQTLYCEMDAAQRRLCEELRDHYRMSLLGRVPREGLEKSKIQVLEALLRLRQAACHPGLLDAARIAQPCAKLDVLLPRLQEVVAEGHKALVFSQFTSFLAIVRERLEGEGLTYAYLDGQTRDREDCVRRFQEDSGCGVFLISLKAGGLGLNLTAAQYVFILDPWWNPAVEAQAVDRSHRIGQTRQVFAYRLVVRDSIEEKVLALQDGKRALADAIIGADNSLIRNLGREDLELLLS